MKATLGLFALALLGGIVWMVLAAISWQERRLRPGFWWLTLGIMLLAGLGVLTMAHGGS